MSDEVEFVKDLPPMRHGRGQRIDWRSPLKARPGEWAIIKRAAKVSASAYRQHHRGAGFEFTTRTLPDGSAALYARYVGNGKAE